MKSKRRHELKTNVLADWLEHKIEAIKPYSQWIIGGALAVVVLIGAYLYFVSNQSSRKAKAWDAYYGASFERKADQLTQVAQDFSGTQPGLWALIQAGDLHLGEGIGKLYQDRKAGEELIKKAIGSYQLALDGSKAYPMLQQRARFALGQAYEAMGEFDKAKAQYQELAKDAETTAIGKGALRKLQQLNDPAVAEVYRAFASFDQATIEGATVPGSSGFDLPERHDLSFPDAELNALETPEDTSSMTESDPETTPEKSPAESTVPEETTPEKTTPPAEPVAPETADGDQKPLPDDAAPPAPPDTKADATEDGTPVAPENKTGDSTAAPPEPSGESVDGNPESSAEKNEGATSPSTGDES